MAGDPSDDAHPRDDTLRLVLAAGHEGFLADEMRQYRFANLFLIVPWLAADALFAVVERAAPGDWPDWFATTLMFVVLATPFPLAFLVRNAHRVRACADMMDAHVRFLAGYNRQPEIPPADIRRRAERAAAEALLGAAAVATGAVVAIGVMLF